MTCPICLKPIETFGPCIDCFTEEQEFPCGHGPSFVAKVEDDVARRIAEWILSREESDTAEIVRGIEGGRWKK
jgi:hypothetical protein